MTGTKFRISFIQYMPKKPKKFGLKIHALCELVSGYCLSFQIYTRKNEKAVEHRFSHRVVFDLLQRFLGKGHQFYFCMPLEGKQDASCLSSVQDCTSQ